MANDPCAARVAARSGISEADAERIIADIDDYRNRILPQIESSQLAGELDNYARQAGDDAELAARIARREKLDNILKANSFEQEILGEMGLTQKGFTASFAESLHKIADAAKGIEGMFVAPYIDAFRKDPLLRKLLRQDSDFQADVIRARHELAAGNAKPPDGDERAWNFAALVNENEEKMRLALNRQGAQIGKLEGYGGAHRHNTTKIARDRARHAQSLRDNVDWNKSFPWLDDLEDTADRTTAIDEIIAEIQGNIVKGKDPEAGITPNDITRGMRKRYRVSSGMEKGRVLIYKNADAWIKYATAFGEDSVLGGILSTASRSAEKVAIMRKLGTRPEGTISSIVQKRTADLRARKNDFSKETLKELETLTRGGLENADGLLGRAWAVVSGQDRSPVNIGAARILGNARSIISMAKLGGATLSSLADVPLGAMHYKVNYGMSLMDAWGQNIKGWFTRVPADLRQEFAGAIDTFCDGMKGYIGNRLDGTAEIGSLARMSERFFKLTGLTGWTDAGKAGATRMVSKILGDNAHLPFDQLNRQTQYTLKGFGLDRHWELIRKYLTLDYDNAGRTEKYILPNRAANIPDAEIDKIAADQITAAREAGAAQGFEPTPTIEKIRQKARDQIEMDVFAFFASEVDQIILTPDSRTRTIQTWGRRPGTVGGEVARSLMQFKGFPVAFIQKVLLPIMMGRPGDSVSGRVANMGMLIAQLTAFGYVSMNLKRMARGENPTLMEEQHPLKVLQAAFLQGGALGIYGDFLMGEVSRFGGGLVETAAGPLPGAVGDIHRLWALTLNGELRAADGLNFALDYTPYINMWYTRAMLDYSILYSAREALSPGYLRRRERDMKKRGREYILPPSRHRLRTFE